MPFWLYSNASESLRPLALYTQRHRVRQIFLKKLWRLIQPRDAIFLHLPQKILKAANPRKRSHPETVLAGMNHPNPETIKPVSAPLKIQANHALARRRKRAAQAKLRSTSRNTPASYSGGSGLGSLEAANCGRLCIVNVENGQQLGHLHDIVEFFAQMTEAHRGTLTFGAEMRSDQCA